VLFGLSKAGTMSSILLTDIKEVARGLQTDVLARAEPGTVDPAKTFSLVTAARSLDVVMASSQDRETMIRAVRVVLEDAGLHPPFT